MSKTKKVRGCPHCDEGVLIGGMSYRLLLRCDNLSDCGRYVIA